MSAIVPLKTFRDSDGNSCSIVDLKKLINCIRWTPKHKVRVVLGIKAKVITFEEALEMYGLQDFELQNWIHTHSKGGTIAMRVTKCQKNQFYRDLEPQQLVKS